MTESSLIEGEQKDSVATTPRRKIDQPAGRHKEDGIPIKRAASFLLRIILVTLGTGLAFVGGKMGTAAWQASGDFFSMMMLLPVILVVTGGLLIWTGIKPAKPQEPNLP